MLKLFQRNMALQIVLILAAVALLWMKPLVSPPMLSVGEHPAILYSLLCSWLASVPRLAVVLALVLTLVGGICINILLADVGLVSQNTLLPALLYITLVSAGANTLTPEIIVCSVSIACLAPLMLRSSLLTIPPSKACGATALIGIATLFHMPAVALMLSYMLIAANFRLYGWKDWVVMFLGFLAPYMLLISVLFLTGDLDSWWNGVTAALGDVMLRFDHLSQLQAIGVGFLALMFIWSLLNMSGRMNEHPVVWRQNASTVLLLSVGALGMAIYSPLSARTLVPFTIPFAFCFTHLLLPQQSSLGFHGRKKHTWIYETLFILTLIAAFVC